MDSAGSLPRIDTDKLATGSADSGSPPDPDLDLNAVTDDAGSTPDPDLNAVADDSRPTPARPPHAAKASRSRRFRRAAFLAAFIPAPIWAIVRLLGLDGDVLADTPAAQLLAFTPYAAVLSLIPVCLASAARRWWTVATALVTSVALLWCVIPRSIASTPTASPPGGPELRVMTANLSLGEADAATVVRLVRDHQVDVLALQEFTVEAEAAFDRAGIATLLPYRNAHPSSLAAGSALLSRYPLQDVGYTRNWGGFYQAHATVIAPGGRPVLLESVHVCSPFSLGQLHCWRTDLAREPAATQGADTPTTPLRILAGDFNATLDHHALRTLISRGYRDAADGTGAGWTGTWGPYSRHPFIPPVAIDHVLADRRVGLRSVDAYGLPGSDHRALLAVLVLPPGGGGGG